MATTLLRGIAKAKGSANTESNRVTKLAKPTKSTKPIISAKPNQSQRQSRPNSINGKTVPTVVTATATKRTNTASTNHNLTTVRQKQNPTVVVMPREQVRTTFPGQRAIVTPAKRHRLLVIGAALVGVIIAGRLVQVQVFQAPAVAAEALESRMSYVPVISHRGRITFRNGEVLADSVDRYLLTADPQAILGYRSYGRLDADGNEVANGALGIAQLLAPVLEQDMAELAAKLNGDNRYVIIAKDLEPEKQREIRDLKLAAYLHTEVVSKRIYPAGNIAGPLVGFVDHEGVGQGGIEKAFNDILSGTPGQRRYERGRDGVQIPGGVNEVIGAIDGGDVMLTLDYDYQRKAQQAADDAAAKWGAEAVTILIQHNATGEFWAIADSNSVDPNDRSDASVASGSKAVQDTFEPGSTAKIIAMAAALESGVVTPDTPFVVPFRFETPNGQKFKDSTEHPDWHLTATGILAKSSNTGIIQVSENVPPQTQYEYLKKFQLGEYTGLDLPGESRGRVHDVAKWDGRTRYTVAFGQGISVNAVQAVGVYQTVANGGLYHPPSLIRGVRAAESDEVVPVEKAEPIRVIEQSTAATLSKMMELATSDDGTAKAAQIPGFRIAGKSGTAELRVNGRISYMASYIGIISADSPEFTVAVFVRNPQGHIFGGVVAAPVFREVASFIVQNRELAPSVPDNEPLNMWWE